MVAPAQALKRRWWVNAALALAIAALGTLLYLKQTPTDRGIGLSTLKAADIRRIEIDRPESAPMNWISMGVPQCQRIHYTM